MVGWLVDSAVRMRRLVVAGIVAVLALGVMQLDDAPLDVYPEFEPPAVQVQTEALGLSAEEVEELITRRWSRTCSTASRGWKTIESQSMPGLSAIDLTFEEGTDLYLARQMVAERMTQAAALPNVGTPPVMVQPTASTSRVAMVGHAVRGRLDDRDVGARPVADAAPADGHPRRLAGLDLGPAGAPAAGAGRPGAAAGATTSRSPS